MAADKYFGKENADTVINLQSRADAILEEWSELGLSSKEVVSFVENAAALKDEKGTQRAYAEAFACLIALDIRIKRRYGGFFKAIFRFFARRREKKALKRLMFALNISKKKDMLEAISLEAERLLKLEAVRLEEDEVSNGGKRIGAAERTAAEKAAQKETQAAEKNSDERRNTEPEDKKGAEEISEAHSEERIVTEKTQTVEKTVTIDSPKEEKTTVREEKETESQKERVYEKEQPQNTKNENKREEAPEAHNDNVKAPRKAQENGEQEALPPGFELLFEPAKGKPLHFVDDVMIDNMVLGRNDPIINANMKNPPKAGPQETGRQSSDIRNGKDAHLYDKASLDKNGDKAPAPRAENLRDAKDMRSAISVDISADAENAMRREINDSMTEEAVLAYKEALEAELKAQMDAYDAKEQISVAEANVVGANNAARERADVKGQTQPVQIKK